MRPKSTNKDLPTRLIRVRKVLKSGQVWEAFYYNGRDADGRRVKIPLGHDLNEAKRQWAKLECQDMPLDTVVGSGSGAASSGTGVGEGADGVGITKTVFLYSFMPLPDGFPPGPWEAHPSPVRSIYS